MHNLSLNQNLPNNFILAATHSTEAYNPQNDHVWELSLQNGDPPIFAFHTTFGLKSRSTRLFPRFKINGEEISKNEQMFAGPFVTNYCPNLIRVSCEPMQDIICHLDFYMRETNILTGKIVLENHQDQPLDLTFVLNLVMIPMNKGKAVQADREGINDILNGQTGGIYPVLFMTGGPKAVNSPFPGLSTTSQIEAGKQRQLTWTLAARESHAESFEMARKITAMPWIRTLTEETLQHEKEIIQIQTGLPEWDAAFQLCQTSAFTHLIHLNPPEPVQIVRKNRLPDDAPPAHQNAPIQDEISVLETFHLAQVILPAGVNQIQKIVARFLTEQQQDGQLISRQSPHGLGINFQELPLLAQICLMLYEIHQDDVFLARVFPQVVRIFETWLDPKWNPDIDPFPTLERPVQLQLESGLSNFDIWEDYDQGVAIQTVESPALAAVLCRESRALAKIAEIIADQTAQKRFEQQTRQLDQQIQSAWNPYRGRFDYRDLATHQTPEGQTLLRSNTAPEMRINLYLDTPQRLQCQLYSADERTRVCSLTIKGKDAKGKPITETFKPQTFRWVLGRAFQTTQHIYQSIETINTSGLSEEDHLALRTTNLARGDISCLLPIWARAATSDQIETMLKKHLGAEEKLLEYGIPDILKPRSDLPASLPIRVNVLWNSLILSGLAKTGYQKEAADLFERLMSAILNGLTQFQGFFPAYSAASSQAWGKRNQIAGYPPVSLFLEIAGIRIFSPQRVAVWGTNPFPWPIKIHWRGLSIHREKAETKIFFPDGRTYHKEDEAPVLISL